MKYFCNTKLEQLKDLNSLVGKNISIGGIITKIEHRVSKNGKGWAMFTLEGYDESYDFRIFGEEYLKFRHFLIQNNFTFMKIIVKEGWTNAEGKKGDPRMQFVAVQYLQDVLTTFAKKLILQFNITDLSEHLINRLQDLFSKAKGDNQVTMEVMELQKVKRMVATEVVVESEEDVTSENDEESTENAVLETEIEEIQVVTKLSMPSRKLKIKISNELLQELENMQINFKLN
jgi:DNA polymerase-3 subunit alpha